MFEYLCENPNESNLTSMNWLVEDKRSGQVAATFLLLILLVGLPWNLLVIITAIKERLHKQPTIVLLLNLVVTDLVLLVLVVPLQIVVGFSGEFILGDTDVLRCNLCKLGGLRRVFELMSLYAIAFMAFDRFLFIYKPLRYDKLLTTAKTLLLLVITWILVIIVTVLPFLGFGVVTVFPPFVSCNIDPASNYGWLYIGILIMCTCMPVLAVLVFNVWVVCIVWKNIRAIYSVKISQDASHKNVSDSLVVQQTELRKTVRKKRHQKELHMIQVFGALLISNAVSWLPTVVLALYLLISMPESQPSIQIFSTTQVLFNAQAMFHPIIETWLLRDIREPAKKFLCCCIRRKKLCKGCKNGRCVDLVNAALLHNAAAHDSSSASTPQVPLQDISEEAQTRTHSPLN